MREEIHQFATASCDCTAPELWYCLSGSGLQRPTATGLAWHKALAESLPSQALLQPDKRSKVVLKTNVSGISVGGLQQVDDFPMEYAPGCS